MDQYLLYLHRGQYYHKHIIQIFFYNFSLSVKFIRQTVWFTYYYNTCIITVSVFYTYTEITPIRLQSH